MFFVAWDFGGVQLLARIRSGHLALGRQELIMFTLPQSRLHPNYVGAEVQG